MMNVSEKKFYKFVIIFIPVLIAITIINNVSAYEELKISKSFTEEVIINE